jgi:hypothetical protein
LGAYNGIDVVSGEAGGLIIIYAASIRHYGCNNGCMRWCFEDAKWFM